MPLNLALTIQSQCVFSADLDTVSAIIAKTHRMGVMASLTLKITAVKEDYQSVSGAINAGKSQYLIDNCLLRVHD